jgi:molybdenum cofactor sulfurtransferase
MISNLYGNPHSSSDPAILSGHAVDSIREKALRFFGADPEHFDLIFTANATAAIKIVAESFRDLAIGDLTVASSTSRSFWYGYHKDAHTSLVGVREYTSGTFHCFSSDEEVETWLDDCPSTCSSLNGGDLPGLFAYPGQSNMTGRRLPMSWTRQLRQSPKSCHQNVYSLLDAAALATTAPLDFADPDSAPDFTALSFYKVFGFPNLGALIVRKDSGHILSWR